MQKLVVTVLVLLAIGVLFFRGRKSLKSMTSAGGGGCGSGCGCGKAAAEKPDKLS